MKEGEASLAASSLNQGNGTYVLSVKPEEIGVVNTASPVKFHASCKSSNIGYLITCRRCVLQYVGEMGQPLHARVSGHWFNITNWRTDVSLVAKHFNGGAHPESDTLVMAIELSTIRDPCL